MRPPRRPPARAGFTFIELLVVIAILALLASIVVANLDGISGPTKLRGCARGIGNEVLQLKEISGVQNRALSIEFDASNQRWRVIDQPSETEIPDAKERERQTFYGDWEFPPSGVRIEGPQFSSSDVERSGSTIVTFEGDGEVVPSGFVVYVGADRVAEEEGVTVEVSGLTGLVSYHPGRFRSEEIRKAEDF